MPHIPRMNTFNRSPQSHAPHEASLHALKTRVQGNALTEWFT